jgi:hypothetical protein
VTLSHVNVAGVLLSITINVNVVSAGMVKNGHANVTVNVNRK